MFFQLYLFLFLFCGLPLAAYINLEERAQDFNLETKQIKLKSYRTAFNPSIVRWKGELWMSFRFHPNTKYVSNTKIGMVRLNESFEPIGKTYVLDCLHQSKFHSEDDARLFVSKNCLYAIYNEQDLSTSFPVRICLAELDFDGREFYCKEFDIFLEFEGERAQRLEKNWTPFEYEGKILFSYSQKPHRIMKPLIGQGKCETIFNSCGDIKWEWGEVRGGTPALLLDDEYFAFFHSRCVLETEHSENEPMIHYFMGAYTFSSTPPFSITRISSEPILAKGFYESQASYWWGPRLVVFPCGYIFNEDFIWVFYGRKDKEIWIAKLDRKKLLKSLIPVSSLPPEHP